MRENREVSNKGLSFHFKNDIKTSVTYSLFVSLLYFVEILVQVYLNNFKIPLYLFVD